MPAGGSKSSNPVPFFADMRSQRNELRTFCIRGRILTSLIHELRGESGAKGVAGRRGLAALCVSGGMGVAVEIETV